MPPRQRSSKKKTNTAPVDVAPASSNEPTVTKAELPSGYKFAKKFVVLVFQLYMMWRALNNAFNIRLHAIETYGRVIHEFDPWFNYRATEYLHEHGPEKFYKWYDYMSWYPLGRPVGTTIYPGLQLTSVFLHDNVLPAIGYPMSLNDVCCFVPAWFGVVATVALGLIAYEVTSSLTATAWAMSIMAIIPAHIMRSVGGGYDNESIAISAMLITFYFHIRSLRDDYSWILGILTGLAYTYMAAAWGGYIFVLNMVAFHSLILAAYAIYSTEDSGLTRLHRAYSLFYVIGTYGAMQIPVVGNAPLKSMEQILGLIVFLGLQLLEVTQMIKRSRNMDPAQTKQFRLQVVAGFAALFVVLVAIILPTGYFGPLSSRVRGLFLRHTRTGNPLVDSVAEHQPASSGAYYHYLKECYYLSPVGFFLLTRSDKSKRKDAIFFAISFSLVAYFFCSKMSRLMILMGPPASLCSAISLRALVTYFTSQLEDFNESRFFLSLVSTKKKKPKAAKRSNKEDMYEAAQEEFHNSFAEMYNEPSTRWLRVAGSALGFVLLMPVCYNYYAYCNAMAVRMSNPSIMFQATLADGSHIMVDDYREAYWWLRDNTPEDSRVMAWWDYGYQITGIANRTTIADGNTWNHEHIATLGRALTSQEKYAHAIVRHLADYVLIWTGGGGDDLAKSPHMARIANSVYDDVCGINDPTCRTFGFLDGRERKQPTKMMSESLLYKLHQAGIEPGVSVDPERFVEVFSSKYRKVRIYKVLRVSGKSKAWVADPANKVCDAPGSWYCTGQYPPALDKLFEKRRDFKQLEDFNVGQDAKSKEYAEKYHAAMSGADRGPPPE
jgi:dolichyl-diphosphooligosaccharide--protein glycosyltransferase